MSTDAAWSELRGLFGKRIDAPEVTAFLARYPQHRVGKPGDGRVYVEARKHGIALLFGLPDGSFSGGRTAHLRVLIAVFLYGEGVERYRAYADLPLDLDFSLTHDRLVSRFGAPVDSRQWDTGEFHSATWILDGLRLSADYVRGAGGIRLYTLSLPGAD